ncbi:MAG: glycosyltransferase family 2 protein [bacterium]|nr:glycosyltransferase family 2 protein [bacterium]
MSRISVNIVTWNSMKYLPALMQSLVGQTFRDFSMLVIDNASTDGTIDFLRANHPEVTILRNFNNLGFSAAHNQGIKYAFASWKDESLHDHLVVVMNPDVICAPTFLEELVRSADQLRDESVFVGKLLRAQRSDDGHLEETVLTDTIDSTGLGISRSRRAYDRGAGEEDRGQYDNAKEVFGASGALACFRGSALRAVALNGEYFDEQFFAYKEDVDLAWRIRRLGGSAVFIPTAVAYHFRGAYGKAKGGPLEWLRNRFRKSRMVNYYSHRNHWWLIAKNDQWGNILLHLPWIASYEFGKCCAVILFEPKNVRAFFDAWSGLRRIGKKRRLMKELPKRPAAEMRRWFV